MVEDLHLQFHKFYEMVQRYIKLMERKERIANANPDPAHLNLLFSGPFWWKTAQRADAQRKNLHCGIVEL